jgi:hypothetical protein
MSYKFIAASTLVLGGLAVSSVIAQNPSVRREAQDVLSVDHIMVVVGDLEDGSRQFQEMTGVEPVFGGRHPGAGTQNALVALGPRLYLEIMAPQTDGELQESAEWLLAFDDLTPMGFAVSTTDMPGTVARLQNHGYVASDPASGSRSLPDGKTLMWTTMGITNPGIAGSPFFIQWGEASPHPATTSPRGCTLRSLTVFSPEQVALERLFSALGLDVVAEDAAGQETAYQIVLDCPKGTVLLK